MVYMTVTEIFKIIRLQVTEYTFQTYQLDLFYFMGNQIKLPVSLQIFHSEFKEIGDFFIYLYVTFRIRIKFTYIDFYKCHKKYTFKVMKIKNSYFL